MYYSNIPAIPNITLFPLDTASLFLYLFLQLLLQAGSLFLCGPRHLHGLELLGVRAVPLAVRVAIGVDVGVVGFVALLVQGILELADPAFLLLYLDP